MCLREEDINSEGDNGQGMWDRLIRKGGEQKIFAAMKWKDVLLTSKY